MNLKTGDQFVLDAEFDPTMAIRRGSGSTTDNSQRQLTGRRLLLDDGRVVLRVVSVNGLQVVTEVITGGTLSDNKGINKQGGGLSAAALTDKDFRDMDVVAEIDADFVAISFPRDAEDMRLARAALTRAGLRR